MAEKFNTRDVAKKEIYDSYMGILRISPNEINGIEIDDATGLLNTLYDESKKQRTKITVSDSDGNWLPITFQPKAFESSIIKRNSNGVDLMENCDIIHITTLIGKNGGTEGKGNLYVSDSLKCRSTLLLSRDDNERESDYRHSNLIINSGCRTLDKKIISDGILAYPSDSPNDDNYFNSKNKFSLFDSNNSKPRYKQVEENLYKWSRKDHYEKIPKSEIVIAGNKIITQNNENNEEIPLYFTRDYVLGHFDGHQCKISDDGNSIYDRWGISGYDRETVTKLSWVRLDKLLWQSLDEILTGNIRHTKGRYDELGINQIAAPGIREKLGFGVSNEYKDYAPILGTEMARGLITYHAMPFHRYWFHRTRQALRAFIERRKYEVDLNEKPSNENMDSWIILNKKLNDGSYNVSDFHSHEIDTLEQFFNNGILTPASNAITGFSNSLAKNFILCNGCSINFQNFPNISLTNELIFNTDINDVQSQNGNFIKGGIANYDESTHSFVHRDISKQNNVFSMISNSMGSFKLPNLFALYEKSPRFIRGLNWKNNNNSDIVSVFDKNSFTIEKSNYVPISDEYDTNDSYIQTINDNKLSASIKKDISNVSKLYFHTYDHLEEKEQHQHYMFSEIEGGEDGYNDKQVHMIHCANTRGGHYDHMNDWRYANMCSFDRTYSATDLVTSSVKTYYFQSAGWKNEAKDDNNWLKYCFGKVYEKSNYYEKYTPIPNIGLFLFNSSIFNNTGDETLHMGTFRGTAHSEYNDIESYNKDFYFRDAEGTKHFISDEAPISLQTYDKNEEEITTEDIKLHDAEKQRRKFFAMKMNEAEGYIPISYIGKASGYITLAWSRAERSGSKAQSRNTYHDKKINIASYKMAAPKNLSDNSYWRCVTSIAYNNPQKLGVGDIKNYISNRENYDENTDYYDVNCVTQLQKDQKYKKYYFGGIGIEVDETTPNPAYINLLPLIRI